MNVACRKVSRGQVWFIVDSEMPAVYQTGVQGKNRPWLIVSNNECNSFSGAYTIVPLTTVNKVSLPTHVEFTVKDKLNTILCEQIRTVSAKVFDNPGCYYMWSMTEKIMGIVDEALAHQLGMQITFPNSDRYWESLGRLIRHRVKQAVDSMKVEATDMSKLSTLLDDKVTQIVKEVVNSPAEKPVEEHVEEQLKVEEPEVPKLVNTRRVWSLEDRKAFLKYYEDHGAKKTAEHYDMKIGTVRTTRFNFFKIVRGANNGTEEST